VSLARSLWDENADLARAAREHPFVRGLERGTLPLRAFQDYLAQDAYFLEAFARAYALALARSPDAQGMRDFFDLLAGVLDELRLHASYAARWGIRLEGVVADEATLAYTSFLLATAALGSVGETCAALTPCMRLYAFLGQARTTGTRTRTGSAPTQTPASKPWRLGSEGCWTATRWMTRGSGPPIAVAWRSRWHSSRRMPRDLARRA
jgi:thiaminase/transcriptional activator TenA